MRQKKLKEKAPMSAEWWSFWTNIAVVTFGILAAVSAVFALYWGNRASQEQEINTTIVRSLDQARTTNDLIRLKIEAWELRSQLADRRIVPSQREQLLGSLNGSRVTCKIEIWVSVSDREARQFAGVLYELFQEAEAWPVEQPHIERLVSFPPGLTFSYHATIPELDDAATELFTAFESVGIRPDLEREATLVDIGIETIAILVGSKR